MTYEETFQLARSCSAPGLRRRTLAMMTAFSDLLALSKRFFKSVSFALRCRRRRSSVGRSLAMLNPLEFGGGRVDFQTETIVEAPFFVNLGPVRLGSLMARYPSPGKPYLTRTFDFDTLKDSYRRLDGAPGDHELFGKYSFGGKNRFGRKHFWQCGFFGRSHGHCDGSRERDKDEERVA